MADDQMDEDLWAKTTSPETRFDLKTMIFDSSWKDGTTFMASKDFRYYRTLYDFKNGIRATQINHLDYSFEAHNATKGAYQQRYEHGRLELGQHLILRDLGLQVPNFADFSSSCEYEPYLKMHRGNGSLAELEQQGREEYRFDGGDLVLRTASFGATQGKLEMCARRGDVLIKYGNVVLEGLGSKLPVVARLIASYRYNGVRQEKRKGCRGFAKED
jgi:hypothetical protein